MKLNVKRLFLSIFLGGFIALFFRMGLLVITTDFSYAKFLVFETADLQSVQEGREGEAIGWDYAGKNVMNPPYSGFPFPTYSDCSIREHGFVTFEPRCEKGVLGEFATVLNFILWSGGIYFLLMRRVSHISPSLSVPVSKK